MNKNYLEKFLLYYTTHFHNKQLLAQLPDNQMNVVVDIGSHNAELYDSLIINQINFEKYIAFEPVKQNFEFIKNKFKNIENAEIVNSAIGDVNELKEIYLNSFTSTSTFKAINKNRFKYKFKKLLDIFASKDPLTHEVVKIQTLDTFKSLFNSTISIMKIDTEGYELEVLQGGEELFNMNPPKFLIIEMHKINNYHNYDPEKIKNLLKLYNYEESFNLRAPFDLFQDCIYVHKKQQ